MHFVSLNFMLISFILFVDLANPQLTQTGYNGNSVIINPGVYLQRLPNITFYQTTRPILFKFQGINNMLHNFKCKEQLYKANPKLCENLMSLETYFSNVDSRFSNKHFSENEQILIDDGEVHDFQIATRNHVPRLYTSPYEIFLLLPRMTTTRKLPSYDISYSNPFSKLYNNVNCSDPAVIHAIIVDMILAYEWSRSFSEMCQNKRLKLDVVPMSELNSILSDIKQGISKNNYTLALDSISSYYTLPITECTVSNNIAVVGLNIPIIKNHLRGLNMRCIVTPPFMWNTYTCSASVPTNDIAVIKNSNGWILLNTKCDPFKEDLCLLNQQHDSDSLALLCAKHLLSDRTAQQLSKACSFKCTETGWKNEIFTRLETNTYFVSHPQPNTAVVCKDTKYQLHQAPEIGALLVQLPCNCQIIGDVTKIVANENTCTNENRFFITHVISAEWMKFKSLEIPSKEKQELKFSNLHECLDEEWINHELNIYPTSLIEYFLGLAFFLLLLLFSFTIFLYRRLQSLSSKLFQTQIKSTSTKSFIKTTNSTPQTTTTSSGTASTSSTEQEQGYLVPNPVVHHYEPVQQQHPRRRVVFSRGTSSQRNRQRLPTIPETPHYLAMSPTTEYIEMQPPALQPRRDPRQV